MKEDEIKFLLSAQSRCAENPEFLHHLIMACVQGVKDRVSEEQERATDFETIAVATIAIMKENRKTPTMTQWADGVIKKYMNKWKGKTAFNHD